MKLIFNFLLSSLLFSTLAYGSSLQSCETEKFIVMISLNSMQNQEDVSRALDLLKSENLNVYAERTTASGKILAFAQQKNESSYLVLASLADIAGVVVECSIEHNPNPRLTGSN